MHPSGALTFGINMNGLDGAYLKTPRAFTSSEIHY